MAWTQSDVDTLKAAIVARKFVRSMTLSDRTYTFDSIDDMLKLLSVMQTEVAGSRTRYVSFNKGV